MQTQADAHPHFRPLMPYAVGLVGIRQRQDGFFDVIHCGSGCLVELGGIHGVLTAGHVVKALESPSFTEWGLISFTGVGDRSSVVNFDRDHAVAVCRGDKYEDGGPDLGFIRVPDHIVSKINRPFYSISRRYVRLVRHRKQSEPAQLWALLGVIGERSEMIEHLDDGTEFKTTMLVAPVVPIRQWKTEDGYDYAEWGFRNMQHVNPVESFGGVSGGPIFAYHPDGDIDSRWITGVAIQESDAAEDGSRTIISHGIATVYGALVHLLAEKFSDMIPASKLPDEPTETNSLDFRKK